MEKASFFCKVKPSVKRDFDIAVIKNKAEDGDRSEIVEKLLKSYAKKGLPE